MRPTKLLGVIILVKGDSNAAGVKKTSLLESCNMSRPIPF